ncbi:MAG: hypothetical protein QOH66_2115, partial [Actinomycetota bacterium]|nr:hypothetical protein [Actinomycetota bacterium]
MVAVLAAAVAFAAAPVSALPPPPPSIRITPPTSSVPVATKQTVTATVTVPGGIVLGIPVDFTASGTGQESPPSSAGGTTDANGDAPFTFSSAAPGTSTITATAKINPQAQVVAVATVTWLAGPPASVTLTPVFPARRAGQPDTIVALVRDAGGAPVADGTLVAFTAAGTGGESPPAGSSTTSGGSAAFNLTSMLPGTTTVSASAGGVAGSTTIAWTVGPQG